MEITKQLQRELLDDESVIKDVELVGSDGGSTMASKAILAIQSPVFRRMFYGSFREADQSCDRVYLDFSTEVLWAVVSYCYTNRMDFDWSPLLDKEELGLLSDAMAISLVRVREAANYFELPKLHEKITEILVRPVKGLDCYKFKTTVKKELQTLGEEEGALFSDGKIAEMELAFIVFGAKVIIAICDEFAMRGDTKGYLWSCRVERAVLALANGFFSMPNRLEGVFGSSLKVSKTLESREVVDGETWRDSMETLKTNMETIISQVDSIGFDSCELSRRLFRVCFCNSTELGRLRLAELRVLFTAPDNHSDTMAPDTMAPFKDIILLRSLEKTFGPFTGEEETKFQHLVDAVSLSFLDIPTLASIKPCPIFTQDHLYSAMVNRGLDNFLEKRRTP